MPKRESYASDDGFVEDAEAAPPTSNKNKKARLSGDVNAHKAANGKAPVNTAKQTDDNDDPFWELSSGGTRRVTISTFKGITMINIREHYESNGKMLPGKKGISLPLDQYSALISALPQIEANLLARDKDTVRPRYDIDVPENASSLKTAKKNHEATSEEDE